MADTLAGKDTAVDWLSDHPERLEQKPCPDAPLTRGRFVAQLYEALDAPEATAEEPPFEDLLGIEWFLPALAWAKEDGIAKGTSAGTFASARPITWGEAAVFLTRTVQAQGLTPEPVRTTGLPAALQELQNQEALAQAWQWGLLPSNADFTETPTRAQGQIMAESLANLK